MVWPEGSQFKTIDFDQAAEGILEQKAGWLDQRFEAVQRFRKGIERKRAKFRCGGVDSRTQCHSCIEFAVNLIRTNIRYYCRPSNILL